MLSNLPERIVFAFLTVLLLTACAITPETIPKNDWETVKAIGSPTPRHEAAFVAHKSKLYLIGGRRINPVDMYDPQTNRWSAGGRTPTELHHFQAVSYGDAIYIVGAMTGRWPNETPLDRVILYYPESDRFEYGPVIPETRRRGGAGAVVYNDKIYIVGGITNGHMNGYVPWLDEFDPATGAWRVLPDAPQARDHFQAVVTGGKLYAFAGRRSEQAQGLGFEQTVRHGDIFDFASGKWLPIHEAAAIPTMRAGNSAIAINGQIIIGGGESAGQLAAHNEVEAYNPVTQSWSRLPDLNRGRHGSGFAVAGGYLYTASGSGNRGGEPELTSLERIKYPFALANASAPKSSTSRPVYQQWHRVELDFQGPRTLEAADFNPFTDMRLNVTFTNGDTTKTVRGFYAADGNAAHSGADSGSVWKIRFAPNRSGTWRWTARMAKGRDIAINPDMSAGETVPLSRTSGSFTVIKSDKAGTDFRAQDRGLLIADKGYFRFAQSGGYWLKGGTNSPENLLGYDEFDGTYRMEGNARAGESDGGGEIHKFKPHIRDWKAGDPVWGSMKSGEGRGKGIIGAINYLAGENMNSAYFLTLNILGDGKDVWPYRDPDDFTRFDASKLDQWEIVFAHMQARGVLLHMVIQETENELMLDGGDTGRLRKLYLAELIARFGHHNALIWNLGEENGPVSWRPEGQDDDQRRQMIDYLKSADPYRHPIVLHTHSEPHDKDHIVTPLLGNRKLDGLSFQVSDRKLVNAETRKWRALAADNGHDWLITMDEIGMWYEGAMPDFQDPSNHRSLRRHALWGHLLGGGAGVEWYFGAKFAANDLTSEDWRLRAGLWKQTSYALDFFNTHLPWWDMRPCNDLVDRKDAYCLGKAAEIYAIYLPDGGEAMLDASDAQGLKLSWFDPLSGKMHDQPAAIDSVNGWIKLAPPNSGDWVALIKK